MAHNLERNAQGGHNYVGRLSAWHRLGKIVSRAMTVAEAFELSGANFDVDKIQIVNQITNKLSDFYGLHRSDTGEMIAVVSEDYKVTNYSQMFAFMDTLLGDGCHYETAGVLGNGERAFLSANFGEIDLMASGDIHKMYIAGITGHGKYAEHYKLTDIRPVCENTVDMALGSAGTSIKIIHTGENHLRREMALLLLRQAKDKAMNLAEKFEFLAQRLVDGSVLANTVARFLEVGENQTELRQGQKKAVETIKELFESNDNDAFPQWRGTAYNLVNALTEFNDHFEPAQSDANRAKKVILDTSEKKMDIIEYVIEQVGNAQTVNQPVAYSFAERPEIKVNTDLLDDILSNYKPENN